MTPPCAKWLELLLSALARYGSHLGKLDFSAQRSAASAATVAVDEGGWEERVVQRCLCGSLPVFVRGAPFSRTGCVCFITAGPITKLFAWGGGEESGGHVL